MEMLFGMLVGATLFLIGCYLGHSLGWDNGFYAGWTKGLETGIDFEPGVK